MPAARVLSRISDNNHDLYNLVRFYESFEQSNKLFLVMEALDEDLAAFIPCSGRSLRMEGIASILRQLFTALRQLERLDIIHADVKPSNVVFANRSVHQWRVKLVDFSLALSTRRALRGAAAQSLWYRAPEVALGQAFCAAADVWALGCVAAEMAAAEPLYRVSSPAALLHAITRTHGPLPPALLARPGRTERFYTPDAHGAWTLQELENPSARAVFTSVDDVRRKFLSNKGLKEKSCFMKEMGLFRDLLGQMLHILQEKRIYPAVALPRDLFKSFLR